jgi:hypothetical protein
LVTGWSEYETKGATSVDSESVVTVLLVLAVGGALGCMYSVAKMASFLQMRGYPARPNFYLFQAGEYFKQYWAQTKEETGRVGIWFHLAWIGLAACIVFSWIALEIPD